MKETSPCMHNCTNICKYILATSTRGMNDVGIRFFNRVLWLGRLYRCSCPVIIFILYGAALGGGGYISAFPGREVQRRGGLDRALSINIPLCVAPAWDTGIMALLGGNWLSQKVMNMIAPSLMPIYLWGTCRQWRMVYDFDTPSHWW